MNIFVNHPSPYLTDCAPHGDGLLAFQYLDGLARRGHQVHVAAPLVELSRPLHPNLHLSVLRTRTRSSKLHPGRAHRVEYAWRVRQHLRQLRKMVRIDVIHQLNPGTSWVHLFLPLEKTPLVVGPVPSPWPDQPGGRGRPGMKRATRGWTSHLLRKELFGKSSSILIPVPSSRAFLGNGRGLDQKVEVLPYGIDTQAFAPPAAERRAAAGPVRILFLANLERRKGIATLLEAFAQVMAARPDVCLTIAGDGSERARVEEAVRRLNAKGRIELLGSVPRERIAETLHGCDIFCLPSLGEPFGMSALEAMACGKPVVATAAGGLDDLVDAAGGLKVPPGDAPALAEALLQLASDPPLRRRMGEANRRRVLREFDWNCVLERLEDVYLQAGQKR